MLQERIEGKWLAAFRRVLALNGIGKGTKIAIISETQSRPVLVHLCELARLSDCVCFVHEEYDAVTDPPISSTSSGGDFVRLVEGTSDQRRHLTDGSVPAGGEAE